MANINDEYFRYRKINSEIAYRLFRKYRILGSSNRYQASIHPLILIPALKRSETGYAEVRLPVCNDSIRKKQDQFFRHRCILSKGNDMSKMTPINFTQVHPI